MKNKLFLSRIVLQNFATFGEQEVLFTDKFNAIVGETGSGKSLILDALILILGGRADKKIIRKGKDFACIEAVFKCSDPQIKDYFSQIGHPMDGDEIIVKRILYTEGNSKSFLNFQTCQLQTLARFARRFVDLVGQFENQKLLNENYQLVLLDQYAKSEEQASRYKKNYTNFLEVENSIKNLALKMGEKNQREEYIKFQIKELSELGPSEERERELIAKKDEILNRDLISQANRQITDLLSEGEEQNVLSLLKRAQKINPRKNCTLEQIVQLVEDYCFELSRSIDHESESDNIEPILEELDKYQKLKRKFNASTQELQNILKGFQKELAELDKLEIEYQNLHKKRNTLFDLCGKEAEKLHQVRERHAKSLSEKLTSTVQGLKMIGASIKFSLEKKQELGSNGITKLNLIAETNPGEGFFAVKDIASGGELSRILLALRVLLSSQDTISVFLFDEIDTGIGGETALSVGEALESVSHYSQVVAITHLPQIAKFADSIVHVTKDVHLENKKTFSYATVLNSNKKDQFIELMGRI